MSWEQMTDLEQAQCIYWDMYKDAYGVRPRGIDTSNWTLQDFNAEFEILGRVIDQEEKARMESEAEAVRVFEARIDELMSPSKTRSEVAHWLIEAEGCDGDVSYGEYLLGLPYRYFVSQGYVQ